MRKNSGPPLRWLLILLIGVALARPCAAKWARLWEPVPIERLLENVGRYVTKKPSDPAGHYTLGRLHALAFTRGVGEIEAILKDPETGKPLVLPRFPPYESILEERSEEGGIPVPRAAGHLTRSITSYRNAVRRGPGVPLYSLGLAWMLEQGAPLAGVVAAPFVSPPRIIPAARWQSEALLAYRRAYRLALQKDLARDHLGPEANSSVALEAGEGILRILGPRAQTPAERAEIDRVRAAVKTLQEKPRYVTPILFPTGGPTPLGDLLAAGASVTFDLAGDGQAERWPWVGPNTGILVWDPEGTGQIGSGRQLFGSATWSMFWSDGYAALAALDDDGDGWLAGKELAGLAAWRDSDGDGVSDPGEVRPLARLGITRVAARGARWIDGVFCHPAGIERRDGSVLPTYDWMPRSLGPRKAEHEKR
jgi:hypothetical protein